MSDEVQRILNGAAEQVVRQLTAEVEQVRAQRDSLQAENTRLEAERDRAQKAAGEGWDLFYAHADDPQAILNARAALNPNQEEAE